MEGQQWAYHYEMIMKQKQLDDGAAKTETPSGPQGTEAMPGLITSEALDCHQNTNL